MVTSIGSGSFDSFERRDPGSGALTTRGQQTAPRTGQRVGDEMGDQAEGRTGPCGLLHRPEPGGRPGTAVSRVRCSEVAAAALMLGRDASQRPEAGPAGPAFSPGATDCLPGEPFSRNSGDGGPDPQGSGPSPPVCSRPCGPDPPGAPAPIASPSLPPWPVPHPREEFPEPEGGRKYRALPPGDPPTARPGLCPVPNPRGCGMTA